MPPKNEADQVGKVQDCRERLISPLPTGQALITAETGYSRTSDFCGAGVQPTPNLEDGQGSWGSTNISHSAYNDNGERLTSKISKPAMSRMPMKEAPCLFVLSRALLMRITSQRNIRSYVALAKASMAKSACNGREGEESPLKK